MRVTIIRDDGVVGVDGVFRNVDVSAMPEGVRVMQWDGAKGHVEFYDYNVPNEAIDTIEAIQSFIDLWNAAAPPPPPDPTPADIREAAHQRINAAYEAEIAALTADYPASEVSSWAKQEEDARAILADPDARVPWLRSAALARGIAPGYLAALIIQKAEEFAPVHGALTGKRQQLRDQIEALGDTATQEQADAIQW